MPDIAYLRPGDLPTADHWNDFWGKFDAKVAAAMDGHCLPYASTTWNPDAAQNTLWGRLFFFVGANRVYTAALGGSSYVHQPFVDAVAATAGDAAFDDTVRRVVRLQAISSTYFTSAGVPYPGSLLDYSLEAHTKVYNGKFYFVMDQGSYVPEKIYHTALADLMVEDWGATLLFQARWTKYNFFRINNCQNIGLTVVFQGNGGTSFSVTVPPYGSQCVRRTGVDGVYTLGYKYFQRTLPGDFRFAIAGGSYVQGSPVVRSALANNVISPFNVFQLFQGNFDGTRNGPNRMDLYSAPALIRDFTIAPDALAALSQGGKYWPTSVSDGAILGDYLYHRGIIKNFRPGASVPTVVDVPFNGFATAVADMAAVGVTLGTHADGSPTLLGTGDLALYSSNLILNPPNAEPDVPVVGIGSAFKVYSVAPGGTDGEFIINTPREYEMFVPWTSAASTAAVSYDAYPGGGSVSTTLTHTNATRAFASGARPNLNLHVKTVADLKNLNLVGNPSFNAGNQETTIGKVIGKQAVMTWGGFTLQYVHKVAQLYMPVDGAVYGYFRAGALAFDGSYMTEPSRVQFGDYGWLGEYRPQDPITGNDADGRGYGYLYSPRGPVLYDQCVVVPAGVCVIGTQYKHPASIDEPYGSNGKDVTIGRLSGYDPGIRILAPFGAMPRGPRNSTNPNLAFGASVLTVSPKMNLDVLYGLYRNYASPSWYNANRSRLLANTLNVNDGVDGAGFMTVARRLPLGAEGFNCMALIVNQFTRALPLNFVDNALVIVDGSVRKVGEVFGPTSTGIFSGSSIRPAESYRSMGLSDSAYKAAQAMGITIRNIVDFPPSWATVKATSRQDIYGHKVGAGVGLITYDALSIADDVAGSFLTLQEAFGAGGTEPANWYWVRLAEVRSAAVGLGFQFIFEQVTVGFKLEVFTGSNPTIVANNWSTAGTPDGLYHDLGTWSRVAALITAASVEEVEFVGEGQPFWTSPGAQGSSSVGTPVGLVDKLPNGTDFKPDYWGGYQVGTGGTNRLIYQLDMDVRVREIKTAGNHTYHACYRGATGGGAEAVGRLLFRNWSTPARNGFALAFPQSRMVPDAYQWSSDAAHYQFRDTHQERSYGLTASQVPTDPTGVDMSTFSLRRAVNRSADDELLLFSDFTAPGLDRLYLRMWSDNLTRL